MALTALRAVRNLPLFWKLLVPFLVLILLLGVVGAYFITRDLTSKAQTRLDQDLLRHSLDARSILHDRELYLLESANFAANLQGMAEAIKRGDAGKVTALLKSVLALKPDLNLLIVTNIEGTGMTEFSRRPEAEPQLAAGSPWRGEEFVARALVDPLGAKWAGFPNFSERTTLAIAAPVCSGTSECLPVGAAIVGIEIERLTAEAIRSAGDAPAPRPGLVIYDERGRTLAASGLTAQARPPETEGDELVRRDEEAGGSQLSTLYAPLLVQGRRAGTVAVSLPAEAVFSGVRGAGVRLALVFLAAMAGIVAIGALLSRAILSQMRALLETNRALGRGELFARAPVHGTDEIGELAEGVNQMAEQLEASYENLEMRVAERTEEVQRLLRERTEFFASLSHELRTPLAIILGQAKMMRDPDYPKRNGWTGQSGRTIEDSAQQLLTLVNDILDLARAEASSIEVNLENVDLYKFVKEMRPTIEGLARTNGLSVALELGRDLPAVKADRDRLRQVILNLVDNAVKYTPEGGRVEVRAAAGTGLVELSVLDTGVGIPPDVGELIFEPFYRVESTTSQRGAASTGLGLALSKRLVEAQNGSIAYQSKPGSGTTFTVTLVSAERKSNTTRSTRSRPRARAVR